MGFLLLEETRPIGQKHVWSTENNTKTSSSRLDIIARMAQQCGCVTQNYRPTSCCLISVAAPAIQGEPQPTMLSAKSFLFVLSKSPALRDTTQSLSKIPSRRDTPHQLASSYPILYVVRSHYMVAARSSAQLRSCFAVYYISWAFSSLFSLFHSQKNYFQYRLNMVDQPGRGS